MNLYGALLEIKGNLIYYSYGTDLNDLSGILLIDTNNKSFTNIKKPDGGVFLVHNFESFAGKILTYCLAGNIKERVSREIG